MTVMSKEHPGVRWVRRDGRFVLQHYVYHDNPPIKVGYEWQDVPVVDPKTNAVEFPFQHPTGGLDHLEKPVVEQRPETEKISKMAPLTREEVELIETIVLGRSDTMGMAYIDGTSMKQLAQTDADLREQVKAVYVAGEAQVRDLKGQIVVLVDDAESRAMQLEDEVKKAKFESRRVQLIIDLAMKELASLRGQVHNVETTYLNPIAETQQVMAETRATCEREFERRCDECELVCPIKRGDEKGCDEADVTRMAVRLESIQIENARHEELLKGSEEARKELRATAGELQMRTTLATEAAAQLREENVLLIANRDLLLKIWETCAPVLAFLVESEPRCECDDSVGMSPCLDCSIRDAENALRNAFNSVKEASK